MNHSRFPCTRLLQNNIFTNLLLVTNRDTIANVTLLEAATHNVLFIILWTCEVSEVATRSPSSIKSQNSELNRKGRNIFSGLWTQSHILYVCVKNKVCIPPVPSYYQEFKDRIQQAVELLYAYTAKHGTNLRNVSMWSGLPREPILNIYRLI
jgi:hypothetical protein